jgi:hypothetical protein
MMAGVTWTETQAMIFRHMSDHERSQWRTSGMPLSESHGDCVVCGERVWDWTDPAEMHDPRLFDGTLQPDELMVLEESVSSGIVHADCGLGKGWVIS